MIDYARFHFLDASALVKLLLHPDIIEEGSERLADYRRDNSNFGTINLCITEALTVIKSKHFGSKKNRSLNLDGYLIVANRLKVMLGHKTIRAFEFDFLSNRNFTEACHLVKNHGIDLIDAFQLLSVSSGPFSSLTGKSHTLFITADENLSKAAQNEGIETWYCIRDAPSN